VCANERATTIPSAPSDLSAHKRVQREFRVLLPREHGRALGLRAGHAESGHALVVEGVAGGGLLEIWNKAYPSRQVTTGDEIVNVNGRSGDSQALAEELGKARRLEVLVRGLRRCEEAGSGLLCGPPRTPSIVSEAASSSELAAAKAEGAPGDPACCSGDEAPPEVDSPPPARAPGAAGPEAAAPGPRGAAGSSQDPHDWRPFADAQHFDLEDEDGSCVCGDGGLFGCGGEAAASGRPRGPGPVREPAPEPHPRVQNLGGAPRPEPAGRP